MQRRLSRNLFLTIIVLTVLVTSSTWSAAATVTDMTEAVEVQQEIMAHYFDLKSTTIGILYDSTNDLTKETGESLYTSLSLLTPNAIGIPITSFNQIEQLLESGEIDIAIYVFPTNSDGLVITKKESKTELTSWQIVAETLNVDVLHIFATGNTLQLFNHVNPNLAVYGPNSEKEDAKHMFMYALWTLADVLTEHYSNDPTAKNFAEDIRKASLQFFSDNFNDLLSRSIEPYDTMGVENPLTILTREKEFYDKHPSNIERIPRPGYQVDNASMRDIDASTGALRDDGYVIDMFPKTSALPTDFILQLVPLESGLRGPIGGIVDKLLELLFEELKGAIGLDKSTVEQIATALMQIPDLIGAVSNSDSSKLKEFLSSIKNMLPIAKDKMKYFDLVVDGLFLLRGNTTDIIGFIQTAIPLLIPDEWAVGGVTASEFLTDLLDLGSDITTKISEGKGVFDVILSVFNSKFMALIAKQLIKAVGLGGNDTESAEAEKYVIKTTELAFNLLSKKDSDDLIEPHPQTGITGVELLDEIFSKVLDLNRNQSRMLMISFDLILSSLNIVDDVSLLDLFISLFKEISLVDEFLIKGKSAEIVEIFAVLSSGTGKNFEDFRGQIESIILDLDTSDRTANALMRLIGLVAPLYNPNPTIGSADGIISFIAEALFSFGVVNETQVNTINVIFRLITGLVITDDDDPDIRRLVEELLPGIGNQTELIADTVKFFADLVKPNTTTSLFHTQTVGGSVSIVEQGVSTGKLLKVGAKVLVNLYKLAKKSDKNSIQALLQSLLTGSTLLLSKLVDTDLTPYLALFEGVFGEYLGVKNETISIPELKKLLNDTLPGYETEINKIVDLVMLIRDIFTDGFKTVFTQLTGWISGKVSDLILSLSGDIGSVLGDNQWDLLDIDVPIGIGSFSLFNMNIKLGISPGFEFNEKKFSEMLFDLVFRGKSIFKDDDSLGNILRQSFKFFSIVPIFQASIELDAFGSGDSAFVQYMLETLGVEIDFTGSGYFKLKLFSITNGIFGFDNLFKVIKWGFGFKITISKTLTLLDFVTGGVGGGLNSIGAYIGLDAITITIAFSIALDVVNRAATANAPETGSLTVALGIAFTIHLGVDLGIASLSFTGTLEIVLTFLQDLISDTPMRIFISIQLTIIVTIGFLFWDWDLNFQWSPSGYAPPLGKELTFTEDVAASKGALGADNDSDGLSNIYEANTANLNPNSADTDGDTLSDKFELQGLGTSPGKADTDGDGLNDNIELLIKTDPLSKDTDFDGLSDYEESVIIGTNPLERDSDFDLLTDYYEVHHSYNLTGVTPTVSTVTIGANVYNDHTDPLNPDTDGDTLIDGMEGENGIYYGPILYTPDLDLGDDIDLYVGDPPLIFNQGYTHPLDADTDDDSVWQLYDGSKARVEIPFLLDMNDGVETKGQWITFIDPDTGIPEAPRLVTTNPTNPDSDGDTGAIAADRIDPPFGLFLASDGYELSREPPTDPLDSDSDNDGLLDGLEGFLRPDSNQTNALNADTDGDGLGDMQELMLETDPRSVDTDRDGVIDGLEFYRFHTNPFLLDTDFDGLTDFEEVYTYHTNPLATDTDRDGINDFHEVWKYFSNPNDEDGDNDFLTDFEEIFVTFTNPFDPDTDRDGLFDGEEISGWEVPGANGRMYLVQTDPNKWDTDEDSLLTLDQNGDISQSLNDYDEFLLGTNPTIRDTDFDGIEDGWELWVGRGLIPNFNPIILDPLNNDTDNDRLLDGSEFVIGNITTLLQPYFAFVPIYPLNTVPDNNDTDNDNLDDFVEISNAFNAASNDTDGDGLSDYAEFIIHDTSVIKNDTDGDGLSDLEEINGIDILVSIGGVVQTVTTSTYPDNSDSDGDLLPDGAEVYRYNRNPNDPDENNNGILDGMEIDSDGDGLMDGQEYYEFFTQGSPYGGGVDDVDSDKDGLFDGFEAYDTYSSPTEFDTDHDSYSDGLEYFCGTDLLNNSTTQEEMDACFEPYITITILSPAHKLYKTNSIPVIVFDRSFAIREMEYQFKQTNETDWSRSITMSESNISIGYWNADYLSLPTENGKWELEVTAINNVSETFTRRVEFELDINFDGLKILSPKSRTYSFNEFEDPELPIKVEAGLNYNSVWYRMKKQNGETLMDNTTLFLDRGLGQYHQKKFSFPDKDGTNGYVIEVFGSTLNGTVISLSTLFKIKTPTVLETVTIVAVPIVVGGAGIAVLRSNRFKNPFRKQVPTEEEN